MEEENIAWATHDRHVLEVTHDMVDTLRVSSLLVANLHVRDPTCEVGASKHSQAPIQLCVLCERHHYGDEARVEAAILVPVAIVLVPLP